MMQAKRDTAGHGVKLIRKRTISSSRDRVPIKLYSNINSIPQLNLNWRLSIVCSKGPLRISSKSKQFIENVAVEKWKNIQRRASRDRRKRSIKRESERLVSERYIQYVNLSRK